MLHAELEMEKRKNQLDYILKDVDTLEVAFEKLKGKKIAISNINHLEGDVKEVKRDYAIINTKISEGKDVQVLHPLRTTVIYWIKE